MRLEEMGVKSSWVVCGVLTLFFQVNRGTECQVTPSTLNVEYKEQKLFSPGYPNHYSNFMDCTWIFQATLDRTAGFGIQIATIEIELDPDHEATTVGQCDNDYLELFEGTPSNLGQSIGIWCGKDRKVWTSPNSTLFLKFHSNGHHTGKGFVIEYAIVKLASTKCDPGKLTHIYASRAPLYVGFTVNTESRCMWRIEAIDNSGVTDCGSTLVVEAFSIPRIGCRDGHFILYDGPNTSSSEVLHWCNGGEAFSVVFLSSNYATLTFIFKGSQQFQSDTMQLKLYSTSIRFPQICTDSVMPDMQVNKNPVYFHLPLTDAKGSPCPVHVSQRIETNYLRIDVMSVDGHLPTCDSDVVTVTRALVDKEQVEKSCNRRQFPMYLPKVSAAIINSTEKVLLRAVSADPLCSGISFANVGTTSLIIEDTLPKGFMHGTPIQNCISKYLITATNENLAIALQLEWTLPLEQGEYVTGSDFCSGDFVNIYDGKNESSPLLFSTCHKIDQPDIILEKRIIGKSHNMLILFNSDDVADSSIVRLVYYAVPQNTDCLRPWNVTVTADAQELTSPHYPHFFPLDYNCTYRLTAKNPEDVIVIEAIDTEFTHGCDKAIHIYNGHAGEIPEQYLGHVCGHDKDKKFNSSLHQVLIQFTSDEMGLVGRWKLKIYSQGNGSAGRKLEDIVITLLTLGCLLIHL